MSRVAFNPSDIQSIKLKKSSVATKDSSAPVFTDSKQALDYEQSVLDCNIEQWYPLLKHFTFETDFMSLSQEDAALIINTYKQYIDNKSTGKDLPNNILISLQDLERRLQTKINSMNNNNSPVFIKTSSRCAKNNAFQCTGFMDSYINYAKKELNRLKQNHPNPTDLQLINSKLTALLRAATIALKMTSAKETITILTQSDRIYEDMELALDHYKSSKYWQQNIVIRKWIDIDNTLEFRCFVYNAQLTAISQYTTLLYVDKIVKNKDKIRNLIMDCFNNNVKNQLATAENNKYFKYVIDFGFELDENSNNVLSDQFSKLWVIEINPYELGTHAAEFDWKKDALLLQGDKQNDDTIQFPVFRIVESLPTNSLSLMLPEWKNILTDTKFE